MRSFGFIALSALLAISSANAAVTNFKNNIYLIRHAEQSGNSSYGLSEIGNERSTCIEDMFGPSSDYDIGLIIAQHPLKSGKYERSLETVEPLATSLGLKVHTNCKRTDIECVHKLVQKYIKKNPNGNVLIAWDYEQLNAIGKSFGSKKVHYPGNHYDLVYQITNGKLAKTSPFSQDCEGIDYVSNSTSISSSSSVSASRSASASASASVSVSASSSSSSASTTASVSVSRP